MTILMITNLNMSITITKSLLQKRVQFIDTSIQIMSMTTLTTMITHTIMHTTMNTITVTIIIMERGEKERVAHLQICSKISQATQMAKLLTISISNSGLSQIPLELLKKRLIPTNSLCRNLCHILMLNR